MNTQVKIKFDIKIKCRQGKIPFLLIRDICIFVRVCRATAKLISGSQSTITSYFVLQFKLYAVISDTFFTSCFLSINRSLIIKNNKCSMNFNIRILFGNLILLDLQFISSSDTKALLISDVQLIRKNVFQFIALVCN